MRVLALVSDAFGGFGGIALYNRHLLTALCSHPDCKEVVAIPRLLPHPSDALPPKLVYVTGGVGAKWRYGLTVCGQVARMGKFDLILCGHINLLPLAFLARQVMVRTPIMLFVYGIEAWQPTNRRFTNFLARNVDAFGAISNVTFQRFVGWTGLDCDIGYIMPNAFDCEQFTPGEKRPELLERYRLGGKKVLITVGRLVGRERHKGFDEVLEVLPDLIQEDPAIAYLIVGGGPDRKRLEEKARKLGVSESVVFAGLVPESEKVDHYRLADVFVMPSRGEGFGFVFLEAMACGIPVVASKADGSKEALRGGQLGIVVDPDDPQEIRAGIRDALRRPKGQPPNGLEFFAYDQFEERCHRVIDEILCR